MAVRREVEEEKTSQKAAGARSSEGAQQQVAEERRSGAKQRALKEKRCEIETNKSRTDSYSCGSHSGLTLGFTSVLFLI